MFTTSLAAVAVAGLFAPGSIPNHPDWVSSYGTALTRAAEQHKPVAVFITNGNLAHLTKGETLGLDVSKTLSTHYVAVQIDATTENGKKMADAFGIAEGIVISDRTGAVMALRHEGTIAQNDLAGYLNRYSGQSNVATTEYRTSVLAVRPESIPSSYQYQPQVQQVQYQPQQAPVYQPAPAFSYQPAVAAPSYAPTVFAQPLIGGS
jgi:hypothetical protein